MARPILALLMLMAAGMAEAKPMTAKRAAAIDAAVAAGMARVGSKGLALAVVDMGRFAAALVSGRGLKLASFADMTRPQLPITTVSQFPTLQDEAALARRFAGLSAGLGVIAFSGPQGAGFYKGGHDEVTGNMMVCVKRGRRCVVLLGNDVRDEPLYPGLVELILGETGMVWRWEYPEQLTTP